MTDLFLGVIALAVLAMAVGQAAAVVLATRAVRRAGEVASRLEQDVRPIVANVREMSADAARAAALATSQVERAERLLTDTSRRIEEAIESAQKVVLRPARDGMAIVHGIRAVILAYRDLSARSRRRPSGPGPVAVPVADPNTDDEHASFIG